MQLLLVAIAGIAMVSLAEGGSLDFPLLKSCPEGQEISYNSFSRKLDCSCKQYHLYWPETGLCYPELSRGPCRQGHKLVWNPLLERAECSCPTFWSLADDGNCYEDYTQGPCRRGLIFVQSQCVCNQTLVMHFYPELKQCFELYSQGPCSPGHILQFNYTSLTPECVCKEGHVEWQDGSCYELNTVGPCANLQCPSESPVTCFVSKLETLGTNCTCLKQTSVADNGKCYLPYNQGPCSPGHWFVYKDSEKSTCQLKGSCAMFDNWYKWEQDGSCYRQFSQGPCKTGQLFYLDPETGSASCACKKHWKPFIHQVDGLCYEKDSVGPCPAGQYFSYNSTSGKTSCDCFSNHALDPQTGTCIEKLTQGPCASGQLVVEDPSTGNYKCDCNTDMKEHYYKETGKCYEHFTQGPCNGSDIFRLDDRNGSTPACLPPIGRRKKRNF